MPSGQFTRIVALFISKPGIASTQSFAFAELMTILRYLDLSRKIIRCDFALNTSVSRNPHKSNLAAVY